MQMNPYHVVTTISKPTAVIGAVKTNFIRPDKDNLIICKGSSIEIHNISKDGIELHTEFSIYGVVNKIEPFYMPDQVTSSLFILTDQNYFTVLTYNSTKNSIVTESHGVLKEANARISDQPISIVVDPNTHTILVSAFTGILFSIPFNKADPKGKSKEPKKGYFKPTAIRTNEFDFISMVPLKGIQQSSVAVLLGEMNELKSIKTYKYNAGSNEIIENEKLLTKVESTTHTLITVPNPIGGVLAIGEYIISYHDLSSAGCAPKELSIDPVFVTAYTFLNNSYDRCLLGDSDGCLYMLKFEITNMKVNSISSTVIGQVSFPNSIVDLGNNLIYISSAQGDPCIIELYCHSGKYTTEVVKTFSNLGPIVDFCVFDYDEQGKKSMVCCSGVDKDGSLRVVENGIGFLEKYNVEIPLISNVWSFNNSRFMIFVSTYYDTIVLRQTAEKSIEEISTIKIIENEPTLALASSTPGFIVQVTPSTVRLLTYGDQNTIVDEWKPPAGEEIGIAKLSDGKCVLLYGAGTLVYLEYNESSIIERSTKEFQDISCISFAGKLNNSRAEFVMISMWTKPIIYFLELPDFEIFFEKTTQWCCPKDLLLVQFKNRCYFMILFGKIVDEWILC